MTIEQWIDDKQRLSKEYELSRGSRILIAWWELAQNPSSLTLANMKAEADKILGEKPQ